MMSQISCINRIGREGDFWDIAPTYSCNVTKMAVLVKEKIDLDDFKSHLILFRWSLKMFQFVKIGPGIVLQSSSFLQLDHLC